MNSSPSSRFLTGILLINLGTPAAPTIKAVRKYLAEFLSDPRVVEIPRWLWWPILHGVVLNIRPKKSVKLYQKIWTNEGSPLLSISQKQTLALQKKFDQEFSATKIMLAMRYGNPSIDEALKTLKQNNIQKLIVLPLYPQYSAATTASTFDKVISVLKKWRTVPEFIFINHYFDNPDYINAIADSIQQFWQQHGKGEKLLFSFHGLPQNSIAKGDPYYDQCQQTAKLIAEKLQLSEVAWQMVFQSRFGAQKWLQPYCDKTLEQLAKQGCKKIDVICPGFAADCLETLEEMAIRNKKIFLDAGGKQFHYIPALNDSSSHINTLTNTLKKYL